MQVLIHGHQTDVLPRWRDHIYGRLEKLERFEDRIIKIDIVLSSSHHHLKGNETCHITVKVPRKTISVKKTADNMIRAIDAAAKIVEGQIHSLWKDLHTRKRRQKPVRIAKRSGLKIH